MSPTHPLTRATTRGLAAALIAVLSTSCGGGGGSIVDNTGGNGGNSGGNASVVASVRFTTQPGSTPAGQSFSVAVELLNSSGARVTSATTAVSLTVSGGATIGGSTSVSAVGGVATFTGLTVTKAGTGYQLTASSGAFTAISNGFAITAGVADAAHSFFSPTSFTTNATTTLTFSFRDLYSNPVPSATVSLSTPAAGSTFTPQSGTTGTDGTFVTQFRTTTGGNVTITAAVGGINVPLTAAVTGTTGTVNVNIKDISNNLLTNSTYTITYSGGSSTFTASTGADVVTNVPAGSITVSSSRTGYTTGTATGTLVAGATLTLNVQMLVAAASCTPTAITFPGTLTGAVTAQSCQQGTQPTAMYSFTVGANQGARFTMTPVGFAPLIAVTTNPATQWVYETNNLNTAVGGYWLLPTGTFQLRAAATSGTGTFTLTSQSDNGNLTTSNVAGTAATNVQSCPVNAILVQSITTNSQTLATTDCYKVQTSTSGSANFKYDAYLVYNSAACVITMRSTAFDAYLEVLDGATGAIVRSDDDSGGGTDARISLSACNNNGNFLEIRAESYYSSAAGAYTLQLAITGGAANDKVIGVSRPLPPLGPPAPPTLDDYFRAQGIKIPK